MSRQKDNVEILNILFQYVTDNPDIRLGQALVNLKILNVDHKSGIPFIKDPFYEEPNKMLERVKNGMKPKQPQDH